MPALRVTLVRGDGQPAHALKNGHRVLRLGAPGLQQRAVESGLVQRQRIRRPRLRLGVREQRPRVAGSSAIGGGPISLDVALVEREHDGSLAGGPAVGVQPVEHPRPLDVATPKA